MKTNVGKKFLSLCIYPLIRFKKKTIFLRVERELQGLELINSCLQIINKGPIKPFPFSKTVDPWRKLLFSQRPSDLLGLFINRTLLLTGPTWRKLFISRKLFSGISCVVYLQRSDTDHWVSGLFLDPFEVFGNASCLWLTLFLDHQKN